MTARKDLVFKQIPLFATLAPREVAALAARAVEKRYAPGEVLFYEGEPSSGIFLLGQGSVKIFKTSATGREVMLAIETAPSSVAEVPIFDGGPYPATVSALSEVLAFLVYTQDFQRVCREHPEVALKVLSVVGKRLRHMLRLIERVTFGSVRQRVAAALLEFGQQAGGDRFALPVTHEELAARLGTVREVVSRNLSRFQAEGLLRVERRQLVLLDRAGLEREAQTEL